MVLLAGAAAWAAVLGSLLLGGMLALVGPV
jgi:hypothetical protein